MKKIITAINNPKLNEELKKEKNFEIVGKDIQYKEAILEILEKNNNIDLIILSEKILGEIKLEKLIGKIKLINEKIKIIFILEKENKDLEKILIKNNIIDVYYNNKINLNELIKIINKKEINMEEEIIKLKKIIEEKNINYNNIENNNSEKNKINNKNNLKEKYKDKIKNEIMTYIRKRINISKEIDKEINTTKNMLTKIITFSGNYKSGKSTLSLIISQCLSEKNNKVLLIDGDLETQDLSIILKKGKWKDYKDNKNRNKKRSKKINNELRNNYFNKNNRNKKNNFNKNIINKKNINNYKKIEIKNKKNKINNYYKKLINSKNTIYYYQIKNIINLFTNKINKNLYFFNGLNYLLKNKIINNKKILKKIIFVFFEIMKLNYDFIIIDLSKSNLDTINKEILKNSYINFVFMEPNLLGIKEIQKLLKIYLKEWKIPQKSLHIIANKKKFNSMNKSLISNCLPIKNKILEIKENKFYYIFINQNLKRKILLKNKIIKKEINKIIYKIIFNK